MHTDTQNNTTDTRLDRLTNRIRTANRHGRKALIPFLPAGFPSLDGFWQQLDELDAGGADVIEVGIPFSDPCADGPVVEQASLESLERGITLRSVMEGLIERKGRYNAGIVLMGYLNPFMQYGFENLARDAAQAGVEGFIIPDLPLEEDAEYRAVLEAQGIALVALVGLNTGEERMCAYAKVAKGYVYVVSVMGTTGARTTLPPEVTDTLDRARRCFDLPLALGFGIREPKQLELYGDKLDAVIFGSALIMHIRDKGSAGSFMSQWR